MVEIEFDPVKRAVTLKTHKVDFNDAVQVFEGDTIDIPDRRHAYGETRTITIGRLIHEEGK